VVAQLATAQGGGEAERRFPIANGPVEAAPALAEKFRKKIIWKMVGVLLSY
jgi:hypothetical protein